MNDASDEELLAAAGRGDREAFGVLVERHHRTIMQFAYRFLGLAGRTVAEDVAQEVFLRAWRAARSFEPRAKVRTWLLSITTNLCLSYKRAQRFRRALSLEDEHNPEPPELHSEAPAEATSTAAEQAAAVRAALEQLVPNQRAALVLRHYHDLSCAEIAETLGTSVSAVETLLFRARLSLRKQLGGGPAGEPPLK